MVVSRGWKHYLPLFFSALGEERGARRGLGGAVFFLVSGDERFTTIRRVIETRRDKISRCYVAVI